MPQPKSSGTRTTAAKRTTNAKRSAAKATTNAKRTTAAPHAAAKQEDQLTAALTTLREHLTRAGVVISGDRLRATMDDAVSRGRMTRDDAEDLVQRLLASGRKQTDDLMDELERLVERRRADVLAAGKRASAQVRRASAGDRVLREVDRARRVAGIGPTFPILGYDDLATGQIEARLADLSKPELRKVRDYERKHGNRKSVLDALEKQLV